MNKIQKPQYGRCVEALTCIASSLHLVTLNLRVTAFLFLCVFCFVNASEAETLINIEKLVNAIYLAEGGERASHPYGIMRKYKKTTPRRACFNTVRSSFKRFNAQTAENDFIIYLSKTYAPIGASNDPKGLNINWVKNVKYFYNKKKGA
jgi:hypothetical protein